MTALPSRAIRLFGTEQVDPPLRTLRAGALTADLDNGALRYVRIGDREVLRGVYFLVRDENWGTFAPKLEDLRIEERGDGFSVSYRASIADAARRLSYVAQIEGREDGSLTFEVEATPETDVLTNRTGFIVLHPIDELAGRPVRVRGVDGSETLAAFPEHVDPRCPFTDIAALSHEVSPGLWATCTMEGDAFEMEDQRNWSDASYKTYVRPLRRPWPYTLARGERLVQAVRLSLDGPMPTGGEGSADRPVRVTIGDISGRLPRIGIGVSAEAGRKALAAEIAPMVKALSPQWLVCRIDLRHGHGRAEMENYRSLSGLTGGAVVLEIVTRGLLDPDAELAPVAQAMREAGLTPEAVTVFPAQELKSYQPDAQWPPMPTFAGIHAAARRAFPAITIGGGMASYFTELNRKRPPQGALDYVTFTTCPNVHAADDIAVMETLEAIPHLVRSTRAFMGEGVPVRIGPSQLGCRENPYGASTAPNPQDGRVCLSLTDPRQRGLFNAAWMLGYVAACAREGVEAVALGDLTGPFGHIHAPDEPGPWYSDRNAPALYPGFHVLAGLARCGGSVVRNVAFSDPGLAGLAVNTNGRTILWLANLTASSVSVELPAGENGETASVLDADAFEAAAMNPAALDAVAKRLSGRHVTLDAYAVARIDLG